MPRQPFNADARASEREQTPTTIGGREFYPVRLSNTVMRTVRSLARQAEPLAQTAEDAQRKLDATRLKLAQENGKVEPDPERIAEIQGEIVKCEKALSAAEDKQQDASSEALFKQLHNLLIDGEKQHPDAEFLSEHLDTRDAGPLMEWLMTDGGEGNGQAQTTDQTAAIST